MHWAFLAGNPFNGAIQITVLLCQQIKIFCQRFFCHFPLQFNQIHQLIQEPAVNHGQLVKFFNGFATLHCLVQLECTLIIYDMEPLHDLIQRHLLVLFHVHGIHAKLSRTNCLHDGFFKSRTNCHNFTGCLHLCAKGALCIDKLIKRPLRILDNNIVQCRLKACVGLTSYLINDLIQRITNGNSRCNLCNRITSCLGSQCGRTRYTGIYLNDSIFHAGRMQGKLAVASTLYLQLRNDIDGSSTEHLIFPIC